MSDDRIDELVERESRAYNEPGDVPREMLWQRIQGARDPD